MPEATLQRLSPLTDIATVTLVLGFRGSKPTRRIVNEVPGQAAVVSTLGVAGTLRGTLSYLFAGADAYPRARAALESLAAGGIHRLSRPGVAVLHQVPFIVEGEVAMEISDSRGSWTVTAQWIEVPA